MAKPLVTLKTKTPEAGFDLAIDLARKAVEKTQPDATIRKKLRLKYAKNADSLIAVSNVVALYFQTIAEANNYWKKDINIK